LAERAIFGSLSETYRTCGQPDCRCKQGEKHGPHLYISFRGQEGKTTGYYVSQALSAAVREGVEARPEVVAGIPYPKRPSPLPEVLSGSEVQRLLGCITSIRMRLVGTTFYATGLRVSEACQLRPDDIDAQRGLIHVRLGKGSRDRQVPMGEKPARGSAMECAAVLDVLRATGIAPRPTCARGRSLLVRIVQMHTRLCLRLKA
jgi:integrase